ncbi:MAG: DNA-directed RNA polymerase subunit beta' [Halanaerobium sp. 4-GBenrich]|uniref:DNA-directed RNA polymerase subunit beta' n=2 Tax=Halanaerobium congolense TaxID=54121 RepID=A0A1G6T4H6_9FIRM|nr:DNA-directed RNA polymerase subunit beta' [Halanaerobium congolense]KXS48838.1 MAG: DNA-directed RNA polymerase subunit beta' [Halanaerobium sp. T82-1]ODS50562.1 MAG: DNA-directed RNA polymerase subunit beta' [Halanaerobium sp. 4-GBenrich]PUU91371.1 MAG: DNA-directed RNA polymerase subunit beta' [Halanaerobium sp.]PTX15567.1 DNA-directed RNA polymerase subunit beta' [Halanaerobium congolense]PXV63928.1 DNA-directed RNA polymerase subunit beta' [Halanaerobium congolense]
MLNVNNFDSMRIGVASAEQIREWSRGEVKKPETINYRTLKPEKDGLFCEKIFGPTKDYECHCGKYKRVRYKGVVCDRCGVEVTRSKVRRERMGHIELAAPCTHIWYFKGIPSRLGLIMDMSPRALEKVIYFVHYLVTDPGDTPLSEKQLLAESEYREAKNKYGNTFKAAMGAEAVQELLGRINVKDEVEELKKEVKEASGQRRKRAVRRLEVMDGLLDSGLNPANLVMNAIPVIPPDLRPMVQLDGGRFATSDLNDLYRRVINRNNRLKRLLDLGAPEIIIRNEKRMLQESVDALIDNGRRGRPVTGAGNRPLKSLSDMLKGKQGRFRQNLLGKRVDYSGRSVIVVGPDLKMHQCGLPKKMALELFKPFVMRGLVEDGHAHNIKNAKRMVEDVDEAVWGILEEAIKDHPVLLNRAPTLHRLGIQAFEPVLVEGKAIKLHPLVCPAYNADFDGDQMAVHLPLSVEAQAESRLLMLATTNILNPSDGGPITVPTQDMVLGIFYLTTIKEDRKGAGKIFANADEAIKAYDTDRVHLQAPVKVRLDGEIIETSIGRVIFNESLPEELEFINKRFGKSDLGDLITDLYEEVGNDKTAATLDKIKEMGYDFATRSGISIAVSDAEIPPSKPAIVSKAEDEVHQIENHYRRGAITEDERYHKVVDIWNQAKDDVTDALLENLDESNNIYIMAISGARGNTSQISQLAGMRGLMADPSGRIIDVPIRSSFREGLDVLEYFLSTHGARKGLADTALRTADSGYLTRRLVDVSQDVIVRENDCGTDRGIEVEAIGPKGKNAVEPLSERCIGRFTAEEILDPESGEVIVENNTLIDRKKMSKIETAGIDKVKIRSNLTCEAQHGVCRKCYGRNLATGKLVDIGESIGIVAAQSIGEPGTQLTMRTFHTGGVAGDDITQGLPRVEELFEGRTPKGQAIMTEREGYVTIVEKKNSKRVVVENEDGKKKTYKIPYGSKMIVKDNDYVKSGDKLTEGPLDPNVLLKVKGEKAVQNYLLEEVQNVYRSQGVEINDKHIEVIVRQMMKKLKIIKPGDTDLLPGSLVNRYDYRQANKEAADNNNETAVAKPELLGITKASLATDSFLSAASFQETTRVLTEASLDGKIDPLLGLKENVIIGQLIPAGTGMKYYRDIDVVKEDGTKFGDLTEDLTEVE